MYKFLLCSCFFVLATVAAGLLRLLYGPSSADKMMSAQLFGTGGIAVLLLLGAVNRAPATIDVALTLALLAAFASAAFVKAATERSDIVQEGETEA